MNQARPFKPSGYACDLLLVGGDFGDAGTGDYEMVREYMRPVVR